MTAFAFRKDARTIQRIRAKTGVQGYKGPEIHIVFFRVLPGFLAGKCNRGVSG
jgi:hypothetical protein